MAARRLLIVMLVLLGLSTLAAALVPQPTPKEGSTTGTTTQPTTTITPAPNPAFLPLTKITIGGKQLPVVPTAVGDQLRLLVRSRIPAEIAIPEFGLVGFTTPGAPARFELLPDTPGTFGILYTSTGNPAAKIEVAAPGPENGKGNEKAKGNGAQVKKTRPRSQAPAESGRA